MGVFSIGTGKKLYVTPFLIIKFVNIAISTEYVEISILLGITANINKL